MIRIARGGRSLRQAIAGERSGPPLTATAPRRDQGIAEKAARTPPSPLWQARPEGDSNGRANQPRGGFRRQGPAVIGHEITAALAEYGLPVLESRITQRVIYPTSAATRQTVFEREPEGEAAQEVRALTAEIKRLLR